jgi:DNA (cytosine-5)-methyltransferase 1
MNEVSPQFIDVFAGAGGLSLGLLKAGWTGLFAIEKSPMAFETLKYNLIDKEDRWQFQWPAWLPKEAIDIQTLLVHYSDSLRLLRGLPLLAGGPPCQGFSNAGRRKSDDERNLLFEYYLQLVDLVRPQMVLLENVCGFATPFTKTEKGVSGKEILDEPFNADQQLYDHLIQMHYVPFREYALMAKDFGVPQLRPRYILIALHEDLFTGLLVPNPFSLLKEIREQFLCQRGLNPVQEVSLREAISDLEKRHGTVTCIEPKMQSFTQGLYGPGDGSYQTLMRQARDGSPLEAGAIADSHRFTNHKPEIVARFDRIIHECTPGVQLNETQRKVFAVSKHRIAPLAAHKTCQTLTSLPDDCIHYLEPRILTVREYARIQSFPDWFEFKSKYTTGEEHRRTEVPRYTQVANALPPLVAEILGLALLRTFAKGSPTYGRETDPHSLEITNERSSTEEIEAGQPQTEAQSSTTPHKSPASCAILMTR